MIATSDYELVTESVGLVDRSDRAKFLVRGSEAADFLQGQVSNDVEALEPGSGCYATVLTHKGKLRTDLRVLRGDDWFWLDTEAIGHAVLEHMLEDLLPRPRRPVRGRDRLARAALPGGPGGARAARRRAARRGARLRGRASTASTWPPCSAWT